MLPQVAAKRLRILRIFFMVARLTEEVNRNLGSQQGRVSPNPDRAGLPDSRGGIGRGEVEGGHASEGQSARAPANPHRS